MEMESKGLHHIMIMCGDPTENAEFYLNTFGMRMVKKTVNHETPDIWHLFYSDRKAGRIIDGSRDGNCRG